MNGVLVIDKPLGPTSHDLVARVRRAAGERRVGHAGTLDPQASGVLVLCLGEATKLVPYLMGADKEYRATLRLGVTTDTDDADPAAQVLRRASPQALAALTRAQVEDALRACVGTIQQRPPRFSALKVKGQRLHERARQLRDRDQSQAGTHSPPATPGAPDEGAALEEELSRKARAVVIYDLRIEALRLSQELPEVDLWVRCGKGTYIRAIARDVGERLGVGGHLTALRRVRVGRFTLDDVTPLTPEPAPAPGVPDQAPAPPAPAPSVPLEPPPRLPSARGYQTREPIDPPVPPEPPPRRPRERLGPPLRLFSEAAALAHLPALPLTAEEADRVRQGHVATLQALAPRVAALPGWPPRPPAGPDPAALDPATADPDAAAALLDETGALAAVVLAGQGGLRIGRGFARPSPGGGSRTTELTPHPVGRKTTPQD